MPTPLPQGAARQLALRVDAGGVSPRALTDGNYYTDYTFPAGTTITLEAEEEIVSLYIIFGSYPDEWTLLSDQTRQSCGTNTSRSISPPHSFSFFCLMITRS